MRFKLALAALILFGSGVAQAAKVAALELTVAAVQQPTPSSAKVVGHL